MVKLQKLWGDAKFAPLSPISKLIYCYLCTQSNITTLGILNILPEKINFDLGVDTNLQELEKDFIILINPAQILIVNHFNTLPKSKTTLRKAIQEGKNADPLLKGIFKQVFTAEDFTDSSFKPPDPEQVKTYAISLGYVVNGIDFCSYYGDNDWYDKNDKKVRNWRSKVSKVWCRLENKIVAVEGAPEGFEYFYIDLDNGGRISPESWKGNKPVHSNMLYSHLLQEGFKKRQ